LAQSIKDLLEKAGFKTIDSILKLASLEISDKLGIDRYAAQIIKEAARTANENSRNQMNIAPLSVIIRLFPTNSSSCCQVMVWVPFFPKV
jgi:predicted RecB family nuclease